MQRAAYVHHLRLGGRSSRTYALYCEGCGLARAGVSKATVARHKDDGRCAATSIKLHADPNTAPPQLRDLCLGAERALRNGDAQGLADFLVSQGVNCPPRYAPSTLAHAAPAMADAPAYHPLPPLASSRSSVATMAPAAAAGGSNQVTSMEVDAEAEAKAPQLQQADAKAARIPVPMDEVLMEVDAEAGAPAALVPEYRPVAAAMACASRSATDASTTSTTPQILDAVENTVLMAHRDKRIMMVGMDEKGGLVVDVEVESDVTYPRHGGAGPPVAFDNKVDRSTREAAILGTALAKLIYPTLRIVVPHLFAEEGTALLTALLTGTMFLRIGQPSCKMDGASLALAVCLGTLGLLSGGRISLAGYVAIGVLNACGRVGKVQGLKAKALGVDIVNKLQMLRNGQRVASIERVIFPAEQEEEFQAIRPRPQSFNKWEGVDSLMEAVQILLPEDRRKAFEERLLADEDSRMLIGNCLTLPDSQDKDPLDVVAVFYRGKGRVVVTGIDPDHAAGFEGLIRRYLHFFLVKVHGGHDDALAKLRVRYNRAKGIVEDEDGNALDLLVSVGSPGDSHVQPKYELPIAAAITQAILRKASGDEDVVVTYVVTGGIMGEDVACPYLWPEGRPDISSRDLYGYFPTLRPYKPDGQSERLVFISHQHIEREIRFAREGLTMGVFIKSLRHLPLAMGYAPFGGTGTLGDVEEVRVVGEAPLSFGHGEAVPFLGQYFPEALSDGARQGLLAAIARVETNTKQSSAAQRARARHTAQGHGERWQQFDVRSHGKAQVPYLPECFLRPLFDLSQTARLPCLGNWEAMFGWNGDTTIIHPVDEAAEVERARKELEVKARAQLSGMVAISSTFNKQERGQGHGAHKDPKDVCAIVVYTVTGEATLTLSRHGNRAVLTQPLVAGSAYVLEGRGVTEFDHAISAPKNGGERVCLVIRYVREELLADLRAVAGARAHA